MKKPYGIEYACVCTLGKLRRNNEDNFFCDGRLREDIYSTDDVAFSGEVSSDDNALFAVFDGMGGEACGEIASLTAASCAAEFCRERHDYEVYLYELAQILARRVADETAARSLVLMGTTAAMMEFSGDDVFLLNIGDSRVYKLSKKEFSQVSVDHIALAGRGKALTRFLGMPVSDDEPVKPYIAQGSYKTGDMFLICTDGVTDMLSDDEIQAIISEKKPTEVLAKRLIDEAMARGGVDNATAILLRLTKRK